MMEQGMLEQGMRRRDGTFESLLNVKNAKLIGTVEKDGYTGEVYLAEEFYAFSSAVYPRILVTGAAAGRMVAEEGEGFYRQCFTANQDKFKGALVLTIEDAEDYGIYTQPRSALKFIPAKEEKSS